MNARLLAFLLGGLSGILVGSLTALTLFFTTRLSWSGRRRLVVGLIVSGVLSPLLALALLPLLH